MVNPADRTGDASPGGLARPGARADAYRIEHNARLCQQMGVCEFEAPALFELDDAGDLHLLTHGVVGAANLEAARIAEATCPAGALRLVPDGG